MRRNLPLSESRFQEVDVEEMGVGVVGLPVNKPTQII